MLNMEYNLLNYNNYNGILKYLNISNKLYLHTMDDDVIEKNGKKNPINPINPINPNTYELTIIEHLEFDLVDIEHVTDDSNIKCSKEFNITNKEIMVNKFFNKLNMLININMQKSINWCKKHNFTVNKEFLSE